MAKMIMRVTGLNGQVELMTDRVVIKREGLWNMMQYGPNAKREIPLGAISEIAFRDAGLLNFGEIEFVRGGRSAEEKKKRSNTSVRFKRDKQKYFVALKEKVFELMDQYAKQRNS